jgi:hypothetical protein
MTIGLKGFYALRIRVFDMGGQIRGKKSGPLVATEKPVTFVQDKYWQRRLFSASWYTRGIGM